MKKILPKVLLIPFLALLTQFGVAQSDLVLTAVYDGNLPGQLPKGVEIYVVNDVPDLSLYGIGSANNGGGTDGEEFTFPAVSIDAGSFVYVATDSTSFESFFGFFPDYTSSAVNVNGDDAIELFMNDATIDVYGEIEYDTFDDTWDYDDGWAYRSNGTGPDGTTFVIGNWVISGVGALSGAPTNGEADSPVPVGTYNPEGIEVPILSFETSALAVAENDASITITVNIVNPDVDPTNVEVALTGGTAVEGVDFEFSSPETVTFPGGSNEGQEVTINLIDNFDEDGELSIELALQNPDNEAIIGIGNLIVTISDDDATIPLYTIEAVRLNDEIGVPELVGSDCEIRGRVHGVNLQPDGLQFTLIDPTDGIAVFRESGNLDYTVQEGDSLHVFGTVDFFNGLAQIELDSLEVMATGLGSYDPVDVTALDESTESNLARLECVSIVDTSDWGGTGSGFNVEVTDGLNNYQVRIDSEVDLFNAPVPTGVLHISGIGGQFDNMAPYDSGYQLLPRYSADVSEAGAECTTSIPELPSFDLVLFPNPAKSQVSVVSDAEIRDIRIVDLSGKTVQQLSVNGLNALEINIEEMPRGLYLVEIISNKGRVVKELIKP